MKSIFESCESRGTFILPSFPRAPPCLHPPHSITHPPTSLSPRSPAVRSVSTRGASPLCLPFSPPLALVRVSAAAVHHIHIWRAPSLHSLSRKLTDGAVIVVVPPRLPPSLSRPAAGGRARQVIFRMWKTQFLVRSRARRMSHKERRGEERAKER